jgi:hypothetical protein
MDTQFLSTALLIFAFISLAEWMTGPEGIESEIDAQRQAETGVARTAHPPAIGDTYLGSHAGGIRRGDGRLAAECEEAFSPEDVMISRAPGEPLSAGR